MSNLRQLEVVSRALPILARLAQAATTLETAYTVPAGGAKVYRVRFANRANATKAIRLAISPLGVADDPEHYLLYDRDIAADDAEEFEINVKLVESDEIRVWAASADVTVTIFGTEP